MKKKRSSILTIFPFLAVLILAIPILLITFLNFYFSMKESSPTMLFIHGPWLTAQYDGIEDYLLSIKLDDISTDTALRADQELEIAMLPDWPLGPTQFYAHQAGSELFIYSYTVITPSNKRDLTIERSIVKDGQMHSEVQEKWTAGLYEFALPAPYSSQMYFSLESQGDFAKGYAQQSGLIRVDSEEFKTVSLTGAAEGLQNLALFKHAQLGQAEWLALHAEMNGFTEAEMEALKPTIDSLIRELWDVGVFIDYNQLTMDQTAIAYANRELAWSYDLDTQTIRRASRQGFVDNVGGLPFVWATLKAFIYRPAAKITLAIVAFFLILQLLLWVLALFRREGRSGDYFERKGYLPLSGLIRTREITGIVHKGKQLVRYQVEISHEGRRLDLDVNAILMEGSSYPEVGERLPIWFRPRDKRVSYRPALEL